MVFKAAPENERDIVNELLKNTVEKMESELTAARGERMTRLSESS